MGLQANILLLIAREAVGVGEDMCWAAVGSTIRMAMYMGLHRDPEALGPGMTTALGAEMRRRLWNTLLEIALRSSVNAGGPPLISLDQFDTEPPGNFDDDQLTGAEGDVPIPKPDGQFSQTATAIALHRMFPQRLAIAKYLNDLSSRNSYAETLRLDAELRNAYKILSSTLQAYKTPRSQGQGQCPSDHELRTIDVLLRRYFIALHLPFFPAALKEAEFAYSRRVVIESTLRLWRAVFPAPLSATSDPVTDNEPLARVAVSGTGCFRLVAVQGFIAIAAEINTLLKEDMGLGLGPLAEVRQDLLVALEDYKIWSWKAIENGETNAKGYLVSCLINAQVEAARRGLGKEETLSFVVSEGEAAEERVLAFLEEVERKGRLPEVRTEVVDDEMAVTPELGLEDWDYMVSTTHARAFTESCADRAFSCPMSCLPRPRPTSIGCFSEPRALQQGVCVEGETHPKRIRVLSCSHLSWPLAAPSCEMPPEPQYIETSSTHNFTASSQLTDHSSGQAALGGGPTGGTPTERGRGFDSPLEK